MLIRCRLGLTGTTLGDPRYDWAFTSVPQKYANNRRISHPRCVTPPFTNKRVLVLTVVQGKGFGGLVAGAWKYDRSLPCECAQNI